MLIFKNIQQIIVCRLLHSDEWTSLLPWKLAKKIGRSPQRHNNLQTINGILRI